MTARLAVVDDDAAFGTYLQTLFRTRGYDVDVYHSGAALLDGLKGGPLPNVVLLDVMMPDVDGLETLRQIRQAHPSAQVIMLSGRQAPATIVEAVRLGAADYVLKPGDAGGVGEAALEAAIRNALERESLTAEIERIGAQLAEDPEGVQPCWSSGRAMQPVMAMVDRVADSDVTVLLRGESGVGKEVIARELLRRSSRRTKPFVKVNCAALPADLLESELFGHERGAFTGAGQTRVGRFEFAQHGTIMLDEIGELPQALQAKLLHVLQDGELTRLGSNRKVEIDVRVIAATNRDLQAMMRAGTFREDLYYRLQVIELHVPPLRDAARGDRPAGRVLRGQVLAALPPPVRAGQRRADARAQRVLVAGQRARAREHGEAAGGAAGRAVHPPGAGPADRRAPERAAGGSRRGPGAQHRSRRRRSRRRPPRRWPRRRQPPRMERRPAATRATRTRAAATRTRCRPRRATASTSTNWPRRRRWKPSARRSTRRSPASAGTAARPPRT